MTERRRAEEMQVRLAAIVNSSDDAIIGKTLQGIITSWNPSAEKMFGFSAAEAIGQYTGAVFRTERVHEEKDFLARIGRGENVRHFDTVRVRKDGTKIDISVTLSPITDAHDQVIGASKIARDITERKQAEAKIKELNTTLEKRVSERTNSTGSAHQEMEAFSYSVSHDLRAPLRSIDGFSQALLEDYMDSLDASGKEFLGRVRAASQRMSVLIDDLLQLSRVTRGELRRETVDLSALAEALTEELTQRHSGRAVETVIAPGLSADADPRLMRVVLENLLANAWKYTGKHTAARIEFGQTEHGGRRCFFVRDDGAGFDMAYANKLFSAFQRLHTRAASSKARESAWRRCSGFCTGTAAGSGRKPPWNRARHSILFSFQDFRLLFCVQSLMTKQQYIEYLVATPGNYTCTHLADHLEGEAATSHDTISDYLRREKLTPRRLWEVVAPLLHDSPDSYLIVDDSVQNKQYSKKIELVKLQYSGAEGGLVRGIAVVNLLHTSGTDGDFFPIDFRIYSPETDGKTKNEHFLEMLIRAKSDKRLQARTVLFDSWYASWTT